MRFINKNLFKKLSVFPFDDTKALQKCHEQLQDIVKPSCVSSSGMSQKDSNSLPCLKLADCRKSSSFVGAISRARDKSMTGNSEERYSVSQPNSLEGDDRHLVSLEEIAAQKKRLAIDNFRKEFIEKVGQQVTIISREEIKDFAVAGKGNFSQVYSGTYLGTPVCAFKENFEHLYKFKQYVQINILREWL